MYFKVAGAVPSGFSCDGEPIAGAGGKPCWWVSHRLAGMRVLLQCPAGWVPPTGYFGPVLGAENEEVDLTCRFIEVAEEPLAGLKLRPRRLAALSRLALYPFRSDEVPILRSPTVFSELPIDSSCCENIRLEIAQEEISKTDFVRRSYTLFFSRNGACLPWEPVRNSRWFPWVAALSATLSRPIIHSSALLLGGRVALLLASDEGGKTTALSLASRGTPLSDDQNILHVEERRVSVYSTPVTGKPYTPQGGPLGGLFWLEKGLRFKLAAAQPREILAHLWQDHAYFTIRLPKGYRQAFFDLLQGVCHAVPCYRLTFPKDHLDWDAVERAMNGG